MKKIAKHFVTATIRLFSCQCAYLVDISCNSVPLNSFNYSHLVLGRLFCLFKFPGGDLLYQFLAVLWLGPWNLIYLRCSHCNFDSLVCELMSRGRLPHSGDQAQQFASFSTALFFSFYREWSTRLLVDWWTDGAIFKGTVSRIFCCEENST
jgi:hypothetical protein